MREKGVFAFQLSVVFHIENTYFKLESDKMFPRKFCQEEPKFKRKF